MLFILPGSDLFNKVVFDLGALLIGMGNSSITRLLTSIYWFRTVTVIRPGVCIIPCLICP